MPQRECSYLFGRVLLEGNLMQSLSIGLIGDYSPSVPAHVAIPQALDLAAGVLGCCVRAEWLPTEQLTGDLSEQLAAFDALWCVPASPYASMDGALRGIQFAREQGRPFLGTCGGFQHALIEYARNVLGLIDADHAESNPETSLPLMVALECALVEATGTVVLQDGSRVAALYGQREVVEAYHCRFGLNPHYEGLLAGTNLRIVGRDSGGEVRIVELESHPFYVATLFQPERSAFKGHAHPLIIAYVGAALGRRAGTLESARAAAWAAR
jgi:CTP synthase (UTP-ammonia lyase)